MPLKTFIFIVRIKLTVKSYLKFFLNWSINEKRDYKGQTDSINDCNSPDTRHLLWGGGMTGDLKIICIWKRTSVT